MKVRLFIVSIITTAGIFLVFPLAGYSQSVGSDGSFNYSIPIDLPPGTNGMTPSLSFEYNSNNGNGMTGLGWSLSGLPVISRDPSVGINYDNTDTFTGPGGKLRFRSKSGSTSEYFYEYENFSKLQRLPIIIHVGLGGQSTVQVGEQWVENLPDGTKRYYGSSSSSQCFNSDPWPTAQIYPPARAWLLSKVVDPRGNYYTISYIQSDGEYYPSKIVYTYNTGITKYKTIEFSYDDTRTDYYNDYTYSTKVVTKKRLIGIKVYYDVTNPSSNGSGTPFVEYKIAYSTTGELTGTNSRVVSESIITNITRKRFSNKLLEPDISNVINFNWENNKVSYVSSILGGSFLIYYKESNSFTPKYSGYPYIANSSPKYVVSQLTSNCGYTREDEGIYKTTYTYNNSMRYAGLPSVRRDLGFETVIEKNEQTGETTTTTYCQTPYDLGGIPVSVEKKNESGVLTYKSNTVTELVTSQYGSKWIRTVSETGTSYLAGTVLHTASTSYQYDTYGNTIKTTQTATGVPTVVIDITPYVVEASWFLRGATDVIVKTNGVLSSHSYTGYSGIFPISTKYYYNNDSSWVLQSCTYDAYGNIKTMTDPEGKVTTINEYDTDYQLFPTKITDPMGNIVTSTYDPATGSVLAQTDPYGTSTYEYDAIGRLKKTILPGDDWTEKINYVNFGTANNQYVERIINDGADGIYSRNYFDGFGRSWKTVSKGIAGHDKICVVFFNKAGFKKRVINEHFAGDSSYVSHYYYDADNRLIKVDTEIGDKTSSTGKKTITATTAYEKNGNYFRIRSTDPNGNITVTDFDALGRLVSKTEGFGTTSASKLDYIYDAVNFKVTTKVNGSNPATVYFDQLGRRTKVTDSDRGTVSYTYYNDGLVKTMTDAKSQSFTYEYNDLGNITKETGPDGTNAVNYTYDDYGVRLKKVTDGVTSTDYTYYNTGEPQSIKYSIDSYQFTFGMEYDTLHRLKYLAYPDNTKIENHYAEVGTLEAVTPAGEMRTFIRYGQAGGINPNSGETVDISDHFVMRRSGNGVTSTIEYEPVTHRPLEVYTRKDGGETYEDSKYWCISLFAKDLGRKADYERYIKRAQYYKNVFDPSTGYMRAKRNGSFISPFDPFEVNGHYTEANSWQYSFAVQQDITGLLNLQGGKDKFAAKLDALFSAKEETTGKVQSDISGLIGQYAHGNEPSHHMAYLYNYAEQAWKTQEKINFIQNNFYTDQPDGLIGNEDCGTNVGLVGDECYGLLFGDSGKRLLCNWNSTI